MNDPTTTTEPTPGPTPPTAGFDLVETILRQTRDGGGSRLLKDLVGGARERLDEAEAQGRVARFKADLPVIRRGLERVEELAELLGTAQIDRKPIF